MEVIVTGRPRDEISFNEDLKGIVITYNSTIISPPSTDTLTGDL